MQVDSCGLIRYARERMRDGMERPKINIGRLDPVYKNITDIRMSGGNSPRSMAGHGYPVLDGGMNYENK